MAKNVFGASMNNIVGVKIKEAEYFNILKQVKRDLIEENDSDEEIVKKAKKRISKIHDSVKVYPPVKEQKERVKDLLYVQIRAEFLKNRDCVQ